MALTSLPFASATYAASEPQDLAKAQIAMPRDSNDTSFDFTFKWYGGADTYTKGRIKDNNTSVCINANSIPNGGFDVQAQGASIDTAGEYIDYTLGSAHVSQSGYRRIRNLINESGKTFARLQAGGQLSGTASGKWSPDTSSYGMSNYPSLN